jgi:hypothetical protein
MNLLETGKACERKNKTDDGTFIHTRSDAGKIEQNDELPALCSWKHQKKLVSPVVRFSAQSRG